MSARSVVVVGAVDPGLAARLQQRGHEVVVADDLRHALLLQRVVQPDAVLIPRAPDPQELGLLSTTATRPVIVIADLAPGPALSLIAAGVARVVPTTSPAALETALGLALSRERPVVRALAQLSLLKASGALHVGLADGPGPRGEIVVDNGAVYVARSEELSGSEALAALAALDAPVFFAFEEAHEQQLLSDEIEGGDLLEVFDVDLEATDPGLGRAPSDEELQGLPAPRCLIVEDDLDLCRLYQILLKARGFDVEIAHDGDDGFNAARARAPDVILSDIMMPRVTGWDLLGLIRNNARLRETPFLLLSHHRELVRQLKTANGGADGYLEKSLRPEVVVAGVVSAVRPLRQLEAQLQGGAVRVDGTLAGLGPQTLLRLCERQKLTGRLALRPASQRFLVGFQDGDIVDAQCSMGTATLRHRDALRALLLVDDGAFTFLRGPVTASAPKTPLLPLLDELCAELERLLDNLRTGVLLSGLPLKLRPELLAIYRSSASPAAAPVLDLLAAGGAPRDLIDAGAVDLVLVDSVVRDLFRKGVIAP